ncbi:MAG: T9SS type A sorting domain-containing protein [Bacteroidetes bacterium]|nr:T9SS type A sorting domain-containing protein [Bacteroidota bacterium]
MDKIVFTFPTTPSRRMAFDDFALYNMNDFVNAGADVTLACNGNCTTLGGPFCASVFSGNYSWAPSSGLSNPNITNPVACPTVTTTYTLTFTDPTGSCSATDMVTVTVPPLLIANAGPNQTICSGQSATLTASGGVVYYWNTGATTSIIIVSPSSTTSYSVQVANSSGCTAIASVTVTVNPNPVANAGVDQTICSSSCATLTATGGGTYSWSPTGQITPSITVCPTAITNYTVTVTGANGCTATDAVTVFVAPQPVASFTFTANEDCMGSPFIFTNTSINATSYLWDFGDGASSAATSPTHVYSAPGQFQVLLYAYNSFGCCSAYSVLISVTPSITSPAYNSTCCSFTYPYTYVNAPIGSTITYTGASFSVKDAMTISNNSTVTFNNSIIQFGPWGKVIVEPGSTLILNGTKFTGLQTCGTMWQGIEVWGNPNKTHSPADQVFQGKLIIRTYTVTNTPTIIERAHNAVTVGKYPDRFLPTQCNQSTPNSICIRGEYDVCKSGGILDAVSSGNHILFIDNAHTIRVAPYSYSNVSRVNRCDFSGTLLKDPGYKTGIAYQYPNLANPNYAYANPQGRTYRFGYILKARWTTQTTFSNNTFNFPADIGAEIGIEIINGKCVIDGNTFRNMNRGISGVYTSPSPFLANKIKSNIFVNYVAQSASAVTPNPVCGIYLSAAQGDRISDRNTFGNLFDALSQTNNPIGIVMYNSSYFKILDNNFNRNQLGIGVLNSSAGGGVIQRFNDVAGNGNWFQRNKTSIFTLFDNSALKIKCNTTNNPDPVDYPLGSINWNNGSGFFTSPLANQGLPVPLSYIATSTAARKLPAGNRFDYPFNVNINKEIKNNYSVAYTYYSHQSDPEYVPFNSGNVVVSQQTTSTGPVTCNAGIHILQCCPTDQCLSETPPPNCPPPPQRIGDIDQQIASLQTEFDSVFANLDKGQTAQLISAINSSMDAGQLKNMLLDNSFLSDETLLAFINRTISTPPGIFKDVMIPNSPVSDNVLPALQIKINLLPPGIAAQIKAAQSSNAYRTLTNISREISTLKVERQSVINSVLSVLVDNDSAQAINLLEQENTVAADQALLGTYIAFENLNAAQTKLSGIIASNAEDQAFLDLQGMILNLGLQGNSVFEMDSSQEQLVRSIAAMPSSLAQANACNLLYLVFNEHCPDPLTTVSARMQQDTPTPFPSGRAGDGLGFLGDNIPNPFNNTTTIPYTLPDGIEKAFINIYDITGKLISAYEVSSINNKLTISSGDMENGVYLYKLESNGQTFGSRKMIIIK